MYSKIVDLTKENLNFAVKTVIAFYRTFPHCELISRKMFERDRILEYFFFTEQCGTVRKNEKFTVTEKISRQMNY